MGRRIKLVAHGAKAAGSKSASRKSYEGVLAAIQQLKHRVSIIDVALTQRSGDAERLAVSAVDEGYDTVIAVGGDGTLHEVVNGVAAAERDSCVAIGVIPLGTANDFAAAVGIDAQSPDKALQLVLDNNPTHIDIPSVNGRCFINMITGGLMTGATVDARQELKDHYGTLAYLMTALSKLGGKPSEARFTSEGWQWKGQFNILALGNGTQAGGGWRLCPKASLFDRLLDILILPTHPTIGQILKAGARVPLHAARAGIQSFQKPEQKLIGDAEMTAAANQIRDLSIERRVKTLTITSNQDMQINLDGEPMIEKIFKVSLGRRIPFYLPPSIVSGTKRG